MGSSLEMLFRKLSRKIVSRHRATGTTKYQPGPRLFFASCMASQFRAAGLSLLPAFFFLPVGFTYVHALSSMASSPTVSSIASELLIAQPLPVFPDTQSASLLVSLFLRHCNAYSISLFVESLETARTVDGGLFRWSRTVASCTTKRRKKRRGFN